MRKLGIIMMMAAVFGFTACTTYDRNEIFTKKTGGAIVGGALGGIAGSNIGDGKGQIAATAIGTLLGAMIGAEVGSSLDRADRQYMSDAGYKAQSAPIGQTINWNNPDSGHYGTVTPIRDGYSSAGRYCRQYEQTIYIDGRQETATGQACQNPDGTWDIVNS